MNSCFSLLSRMLKSVVPILLCLPLLAAAPTPPKDITLEDAPKGSTWRGDRTRSDDKISIVGHITSHHDNTVILRTEEEGGLILAWTFDVSGNQITLNSLRQVNPGPGQRKNELARVTIQGNKITFNYSWNVSSPQKKNQPINGTVSLTRDDDAKS